MKSKRKQPLALSGADEEVAAPIEMAAHRSPVRPRFTAMPNPQSEPLLQPQPKPSNGGWARWVYPTAITAAVVWAGALVSFVLGFQTRFGAFEYTALQWTVIGLLAVLPAAFILLAAFAVRQGARLAAETRRARELAEDLAIPAALAADQTGGAMESMRLEIQRASAAARDAQYPITALRETLAEESRKLTAAAAEAQETGRQIAETLSRERAALGEMATALQAQAAEAAEALQLQTRVVAESSDLAQAQLQEAQAALAARAADLALAAGDASEAALLAGTQLSRQVERLESAGETLGERLNRLQLSIGAEREELSALTESLRLDQEDIAARLETRRAQLQEALVEAREGALAIDQASDAGAEALRGLIASTAGEVQRIAEIAQAEQAAMDERARAAVSLFSGAVAEERAALEAQTQAAIAQLAVAADEARQAAAGHVAAAAQAATDHVDAARARLDALTEETAGKIDHLSEAAFAAGSKADQLFESRITAARRMIEQSASLVEESGQRSAHHIETGLASARTALGDMQNLLVEIDARFARLPDEARSRAEAVREAVERGVGELTASARRASEETQAIDAAFQERVRRNYEMLAEAVRLMGRVAANPAQGQPAPAPRPAPPVQAAVPPAANAEPALERPATERPVEVRTAIAVGERARPTTPTNEEAAVARAEPLRPAALSEARVAGAAEPAAPSAPAGLRPRLRLTPAPSDDAVAAMFNAPARPEPPAPKAPPAQPAARRESLFRPDQPAQPEPAPAPAPTVAGRLALRGAEPAPEGPSVPDEWTWKDLLSSMDEPVDDDALAERLISELGALGIDSAVLLPRPKIDEVAAVLQAGDPAGAREVVRQMAPAAVRRLSRRVLTDKGLRSDADRYVRRYEALLAEAVEKDRQGFMTATLLASNPGRAFLLLDAAIGDLA